ncbi:MAG: hypothetical protein ACRELB_19700 [Polyangiaceae bacterium]
MRSEHLLGLILALSTVTLAACSSAPGEPEPTATGGSQALATKSPALGGPAFVTVTAGTISGYEVSPVNARLAATTHVARLDFSRSGLDAEATAALGSAPPGEVLLEGSVAASTLFVTAAYRGLPGVTYAADATFYQAGGAVAQAVNEAVTRPFTSVDVSAAAKPYVQRSWLVDEVANRNAVVAGHVTDATRTLAAQQIFLALPYAGGRCLKAEALCPSGESQTFTRDHDLCAHPAGCAPRSVCPIAVPYCADGYTLESWAAAPDACPAYACDPSFVH